MLLAAIHDVAVRHLGRVQRLRAALDEAGVSPVTLLCVPRFHGAERLAASPEMRAWLAERTAAGDEVCLHGGRHLELGPIARAGDRLRARAFSRGEAECLALPPAARERVLTEGRAELAALVGRPVLGFVAPAWLEPRGFERELALAGFAWHEWRWGLARLDGGRRLLAPPLSLAGAGLRRPLSILTARLAAAVAVPAAQAGLAPVRLALHPVDAEQPDLVRAAARLIAALATAGLTPVTAAAALGLA